MRAFAESVGDLTERHARGTSPLRRMLEPAALAVVGRAVPLLLATRAALLLLGGDKAGNWERWYKENIPLAVRLYIDYTSDDEE